jgi:hypothetical protein
MNESERKQEPAQNVQVLQGIGCRYCYIITGAGKKKSSGKKKKAQTLNEISRMQIYHETDENQRQGVDYK